MITSVLNTNISEIENKMPENSKNFTTQEFDKLETENLAARLKQADLVNKIDFDKPILILGQEILLRISNVQIAYLEQLI